MVKEGLNTCEDWEEHSYRKKAIADACPRCRIQK